MKTNMDCDRCGGQEICCSQTVRVTPTEVQKLGILKGTDFMNLENELCQFFDNGRCTVYAKRPRACIDFNCCNPKQIKPGPNTTDIELVMLQDSLKPAHWLSVELTKRANKRSRKWLFQER